MTWQEKEFGHSWWLRFAVAWNEGRFVKDLGGLGLIRFSVSMSSTKPVCVNWDSDGFATVVEVESPDIPTFSATASNWHAFIEGEFSAVRGIFTGRIRYKGPLRRIIRYAKRFDRMAEVARTMA